MTSPFEIIVASPDLENRKHLTEILVKIGIDPLRASTIRECQEMYEQRRVGLIFCDARLADGTCEEFLKQYPRGGPRPRVVLTSRTADWDEFMRATRLGAFDVICVPCYPTDVEWMVIEASREERSRMRTHLPRPAARPEAARAATAW